MKVYEVIKQLEEELFLRYGNISKGSTQFQRIQLQEETIRFVPVESMMPSRRV